MPCDHQIETHSNAIIVPPVTARFKQDAGVLTNDGRYVAAGETRRNRAKLTLEPALPSDPSQHLAGRWLWCGLLFNHFGHFLVESQSRLWHATNPALGIEGLAFIPKRPRQEPELLSYQADILAAWGIDLPVAIVREPTVVETLIVPEQALVLGENPQGTAEFHATAAAHFGSDIAADGPPRLYVSRAGLDASTGALLSEPAIEMALVHDGYQIFHPQDHDINTQIARYKAAEKIIFCDGSPLHLFAYLARPDQQVAVLPRRDHWTEGPIDHVTGFAKRAPLVLPGPVRYWEGRDKKAFRNVTYCVHDMPAIGQALLRAGMIENVSAWANPNPATLDALIARTVPLADFIEKEI